MLYKEYEVEVLKKLQRAEIIMLKDFDALCDKHGIDYFGCGGTAIGALRHQGFIPWDDDIDIAFTRENYEKFLEVADKEYPGKYKVLNAETDPDYVLMTTRWVKCGTKFQEECFKDLNCDFGIFLDLYCFENIPDDEKLMKKQALKAWFWGKMLVMSGVSHPTLYVTGIKKSIISAIAFLGHWFLKIMPISKSFLYKQAKKAAVMYKDVQTKRIAYLFDPNPYTSIVLKENVVPTCKLPYEGMQIRFPGKIEAYLSTRYGADFMTPPPEDKRHNHPPYKLDFGTEE